MNRCVYKYINNNYINYKQITSCESRDIITTISSTMNVTVYTSKRKYKFE